MGLTGQKWNATCPIRTRPRTVNTRPSRMRTVHHAYSPPRGLCQGLFQGLFRSVRPTEVTHKISAQSDLIWLSYSGSSGSRGPQARRSTDPRPAGPVHPGPGPGRSVSRICLFASIDGPHPAITLFTLVVLLVLSCLVVT